MTSENRENMHRAIGILEGVTWLAEKDVAEAVGVAVEILSAVMQSEGKDDEM